MQLEEINPHVAVWRTSGAQVAQLLRDGEVDTTTGWNNRFRAAQKDGGPSSAPHEASRPGKSRSGG